MARLSLSLLGPLEVTLHGEAVTVFKYDKVRALLVYLAVEAQRPHTREWLAEFFWPGLSGGAARSNLRNALAVLRRAVGDRTAAPAYFLISHETIQFNDKSDCWLDVRAFQALVEMDAPAIEQLEEAMALYRGGFLKGFSLKDCPAFDDWALIVRERLQRQALTVLRCLVEACEQRGEIEQACEYVRRQVELEPWQEEAHRELMRLLALSGQRSAALAQYESCRRSLREELDVGPSSGTTRLYEEIRDGGIEPATRPRRSFDPSSEFPSFLGSTAVQVARPLFVARERELARLDKYLEEALRGRGQVVFVTGGPGRGKTVLMHEFARRAMASRRELLVVMGSCNAFSGVGDPYLPFREVLEQLTGDVEARWSAGAITREHALRLWHNLPMAIQALVESGQDLIDAFLPGVSLSERAATYASAAPQDNGAWLTRLQELVQRNTTRPRDPMLQQTALFRQYVRVLGEVAHQRPVLLLIDDLQWIDTGSTGLLFYLGRELANGGCPVLIVGAYRPEEVAIGRPSTDFAQHPERSVWTGRMDRHPLEDVLAEIKRRSGDVWVDLARADASDGRRFVDALLDTEPNRLEDSFRGSLFQRTGGHPLFTNELLRAMREQGDLVQDDVGMWVEGLALNWARQPARVEAVIEARVGRLDQDLYDLLTVASVEGERFTAQVVAQVVGRPEQDVLRALSRELGARHRLVRESEEWQSNGRFFSRYQFSHALFQAYLRDNLSTGERRLLHGQVALALEMVHGDQTDAVVARLAHHYAEAGNREKAIEYSQLAGELAVRKSANVEAIGHFRRAVELLVTLPETPERARKELALQLALAVPLIATRSWGAPEAAQAYARARELCNEIGDKAQMQLVMSHERGFRVVRAEHRAALELAEQGFSLAQRSEDPLQVMLGHFEMLVPLLFVGDLEASLAHVEQVMALYDVQSHRSLAFLLGQDPAVAALSFAVYDLWYLGYPDQALKRGEQALTLARDLDHPFTLLFPVTMRARLHRWRREVQMVHEINKEMLNLWNEHGLELARTEGMMNAAWVSSQQGHHEAAITQYAQSFADWQATGMANHLPEFMAVLAEIYCRAGRPENGWSLLEEASEKVKQSGEIYYEAELYRLKGEMLLMTVEDDAAKAEAEYRRAINVARCNKTKMLELRATSSLARLWQRKGKSAQAQQMLDEIYGWFTEGFDTLDLQEARALLDELKGEGRR